MAKKKLRFEVLSPAGQGERVCRTCIWVDYLDGPAPGDPKRRLAFWKCTYRPSATMRSYYVAGVEAPATADMIDVRVEPDEWCSAWERRDDKPRVKLHDG